MRDEDLFREWSALNGVISDWRARFDDLRADFATCRTRAEARKALTEAGFLERYPELPEWLPEETPDH